MARKSPNGSGDGTIISLEFNLDHEIERKAHAMSQKLATSGHGARKGVLIAFLAALHDYSEALRRDITPEELANMMLTRLLTGDVPRPVQEVKFRVDEDEIITETYAGGIEAEDVAANFLASAMFFDDE